jgi:hypothetical protein
MLHLLFSQHQILHHPHLSHAGILVIERGDILTLHPSIDILIATLISVIVLLLVDQSEET